MPPGSARRVTDVAAADPSAGSRAEAWPEVVSQLRDFWARAAALVGGSGGPLPVLSAQAPVRPLGASGPACPAPGRPLRARVPVVGAWPPPDPAVWAGHSGLRSPPCRRRLGRQPPSRGTLPGATRTAARPPRPPRSRRIAQPEAPAGPRSGSPSRATVGDGLGDGVGPGGETAAGRRSLCFPDSALAGPPRVTPVGARCLRLKVKWQRAKVCCPPGPGDCWPRWRPEFRARVSAVQSVPRTGRPSRGWGVSSGRRGSARLVGARAAPGHECAEGDGVWEGTGFWGLSQQ